MEGKASLEDAHEPKSIDEASHAVIEIKIKTLDSQVYTCQVARNVSVPNLKEQVASLTGVPVGNQRLICRGKVLKDEHFLSAYDVEDGHTLHLVARPAPQPNSPATSTGGRSEDQDSHRFTSRNRPGQVSHSVVLGTFNIPDHGDGTVPEFNRILSSLLSSFRLGNLVPTAAGASNGSTGMATVPSLRQQSSMIDAQGREEGAGGRSQAETDNQSPATEQGGSGDMGLLSDPVPSLRSGVSFVGSIPAALPQIRLVQQAMVVPDALTTLSQYLNRVEQIFAANGIRDMSTGWVHDQPGDPGQDTNQGSSPQTQSSSFSQQTEHQQTPVQGDGAPAAWSAIIHRTQELLSNQAGSELTRLADRLANEPNLQTATARGEILSAGILMQHLGELLLELGRSMLTLRMGSSPAESAVNAGPAVFITGPNAMMVQPGGGSGALTGMAPQSVVGSEVAVSSSDAPQNINIQVHAGDVGLSSAFSSVHRQSSPLSQPIPNGLSSSLGLSVNDSRALPTFQNQTVEISNHAVNGNPASSMQPVLGSMQGPLGFGEHGTVRVLPMRTLVAVPASIQARPPLEAAGAGMGLFYPLLARFQQLNPAQFPQQLSSSLATSGNEVHSLPPRGVLSGQQQPIFPLAHPAVRAQVQVEARLPSGGQGNNGHAGSESAVVEGEQNLPFVSSGNETSIQQRGIVETGSDAENASNRVRSLANGLSENDGNFVVSFQNPVMEGPVLPLSHAIEGVQTGGCRRDQIESEKLEVSNELAGRVNSEPLLQLNCSRQTEAENEQLNCSITNSKLPQDDNVVSLLSKTIALSPGDTKDLHAEEAVAEGFGLDGFQPLPCRKRTYFQHEEQVSTSEEPLCDFSSRLNELATTSGGETVLQDFLSSLASRAEERADFELGAEHLSHVGNDGLFLSSRSTNTEDVMPHLVSRWLPENASQGNGGVGLGPLLPSSDMGVTMRQHMQIPVVGNVIQQIRDDAQRTENVLPENLSDQCVADFGGMLQQMMPVVSQVPIRAPVSGTERTWSSMHELQLGHRENGQVMEGGTQLRSPDSKKITQIQESSVSAEDAALHQRLSERPAKSDSSSGSLPVIKRQKMQ